MAFSGDFGKYLRSFYDIFIVNQINSFEMSSGRKRSISGPSCSTEPSSKRKRYFSTYQKFQLLSSLAKALLVLPNSNADSERAFSVVKKIHTELKIS